MDDSTILQRELIRIGFELCKSDKEVQEWHRWFLRQTELFNKSKLSIEAYQNVLVRYKAFLEKKTKKKILASVKPGLKEEIKESGAQEDLIASTQVFCHSCGESNSSLSQFCIYCGASISKIPEVSQQGRTELQAEPIAFKEEIKKPIEKSTFIDDSDKKDTSVDEQTQQDDIHELSEESPTRADEKSKVPLIIPKDEIPKALSTAKHHVKTRIEKKSRLTSIRETQIELSRLITRRTALIGGGSFPVALLLIIILRLGGRGSIGLILLSFLSTVLSLVIDILRGRNYAEWSALGAIICYLGILLIFIPLIFYVLFSDLPDFWIIISELVGISFLIIGVTLRWTEYDEKLVNLIVMAIAYWKNYQKREAIKTVFRAIGAFIGGLIRSIGSGIAHFPRRFTTFLGMIGRTLVVYGRASIDQLKKAVTGIFKNFWNYLHWIGLLAILVYLWLTGLSSYQNIELLIIVSFFFVLGILFSNSEQVMKAVSDTRNIILKGAISAYSMLTGAKIKKEESVFCSRCLRGVHQVEFAELQHVEDTDNPLCPFCGYENWVTVN
ncbi:MAG: zinc ribbon domain-containing protein [Candidatus Hodarchaeales archaeon]|jgi:hypothetical protein